MAPSGVRERLWYRHATPRTEPPVSGQDWAMANLGSLVVVDFFVGLFLGAIGGMVSYFLSPASSQQTGGKWGGTSIFGGFGGVVCFLVFGLPGCAGLFLGAAPFLWMKSNKARGMQGPPGSNNGMPYGQGYPPQRQYPLIGQGVPGPPNPPYPTYENSAPAVQERYAPPAVQERYTPPTSPPPPPPMAAPPPPTGTPASPVLEANWRQPPVVQGSYTALSPAPPSAPPFPPPTALSELPPPTPSLGEDLAMPGIAPLQPLTPPPFPSSSSEVPPGG